MKIKDVIRYNVKRMAQILYYLFSLLWIPISYSYSHKFGNLTYLSKKDFSVWEKAMQSMLKEHVVSGYSTRLHELIPAFSNTKIQILRKEGQFASNVPIVVLCVKNDLRRIKMLVNHYRTSGIHQFAFLDNGSTDGTLEWLLEQPDIDVYHTNKQYTSFNKEAWINRIVSYYGFNRWYILTDSDELVIFKDIETHSFSDVIQYATSHRIRRIKALTLDMYADDALFSENGSHADIREKYCWFDTDSYLAEDRHIGKSILKVFTGGPRLRTMGVKTSLSKYPLIFFSEGTISENAHFQYPYVEAAQSPCHFAILHYKFLEEDRMIYKLRSNKSSGFARGGGDYKRYLELVEKDKTACLMYEGSVRYVDSKCLDKLPLIEAIFVEDEDK